MPSCLISCVDRDLLRALLSQKFLRRLPFICKLLHLLTCAKARFTNLVWVYNRVDWSDLREECLISNLDSLVFLGLFSSTFVMAIILEQFCSISHLYLSSIGGALDSLTARARQADIRLVWQWQWCLLFILANTQSILPSLPLYHSFSLINS